MLHGLKLGACCHIKQGDMAASVTALAKEDGQQVASASKVVDIIPVQLCSPAGQVLSTSAMCVIQSALQDLTWLHSPVSKGHAELWRTRALLACSLKRQVSAQQLPARCSCLGRVWLA